MAGAGYKLFNTGDVLTAAQVNTYLMEQTVMVFANAAARTTALSGVVSEGMISYLKDTNAVEVYDGSNWVSSDDPNAIQNTIVDAKGDLIAASAADTPARLAVGNNGETLVADSSASQGLRWQGNFAAGKNAIINGDFRIWQRGTSISPTSGAWTFCADRYQVYNTFSAGTFTASQQTFTPGTAPVSGYEGQFFLRLTAATTGTSNVNIKQLVEDVRTFAGQTVTFSFWAKASANRSVDIFIRQNFGSGGSASVDSTPATVTVTTAWQRFTYTVTLGSMSGKTIGTGSSLEIWPATSTNFTGGTTLDFWGWQLESSNTATAFQTATGTLAGELAACQRYYIRYTGPASYPTFASKGVSSSTTLAYFWIDHPVELRTAATSIEYATLGAYNFTPNIYALTNLVLDNCNSKVTKLAATTSGMTANHFMVLVGNNTSAAYLGINAEL
jgi:hypothetical protein